MLASDSVTPNNPTLSKLDRLMVRPVMVKFCPLKLPLNRLFGPEVPTGINPLPMDAPLLVAHMPLTLLNSVVMLMLLARV